MKLNKLLVVFLILASIGVSAQKPFREISEIYRQQKQYFATELNKRTINMYLKEKNPGKEVREVLENIEDLKVLNFSMTGVDNIPLFIDDVYRKYRLVDYQPFKVDKSTYENRMVFLKESGDTYSDLLLINTSMNVVSLIEIKGKIDIEKISVLKNVLKVNGLEALSGIKNKVENNNEGNKGIKVCNKNGAELMGTENEPKLLINGYASKENLNSTMNNLNPECIQSINVVKSQESAKHGYPNGMIEVQLKGNTNELFIVCDGTLYFGQNGYIQTIKIDDDCGPSLLVDCSEKPLSEIMKMKPQQVKSIKLTTDPLNCNGKHSGEFVVLETK